MRRILLLGAPLFLALGLVTPPASAASPPTAVTGTMSGAGGFRAEGCGTINEIGSGTFRTSGMGHGTYRFDVCITVGTPFTAVGTITFTLFHGSVVTGTINGPVDTTNGPAFPVVVTGGTLRFRRASGTLTIGPFQETGQTNCEPETGSCTDWHDEGPIAGTIRFGNAS